MATHDLKPKDVVRYIKFDMSEFFKKKEKRGKDDKHKEKPEEPVSKTQQDESGKKI